MAALYEYVLDEDAARELGLLPPEPPRAAPEPHRWSSYVIQAARRSEIYESWRRCAALRRRGRGLGDWDA